MPHQPLFWAVAAVAVLIVSFSKGGFAGGGAIAGVPILSTVIDPVTAAGIMLPLLIAIDAISLWAYRRRWNWRIVRTMLPGAALGVGLGALTFGLVNEDVIRLVLGVIVLLFVAHNWLKRREIGDAPPRPPDWRRGTGLATVSGFTSTVAHAGNPPIAMYLLPQKLERTTYQASNVLFFALVNYMKTVPYAVLGLLDASNLSVSAALLPAVVVGTLAGVWLHRKISQRVFLGVVYVSLAVIGTKLIWDGAGALWG
ncbi:MAG: TSUP family transporter [Alphaproteobacteria bacterium]|nr:TSUP family transporter [Alphaproteobacteria bacterium]